MQATKDPLVMGILGAGHLASYVVEGLRHGGDQRRIVLSPRNAKVAADLAQRHGCEVASSNQAVVDAADVVVLAVRPAQHQTLLAGLYFVPGQLVVSVMAGVSLAQLAAQANLNEATLVRTLPVQSAAVGAGPLPVFPAHECVQELLSALGTVVVLSSEEQFEAAAAIGCMHGWVYPWLQSMADWGETQGLDARVAHELTLAAVSGALAYSAAQGSGSMKAIGEGIAGEGTYTLAGLKVLQQGQGLDAWSDALQSVTNDVDETQ